MPSPYVFKKVALTDQNGLTFRLQRAEISQREDEQRPLRLTLFSRKKNSREPGTAITVDFSPSEAYAFSEWLDRAVTFPRVE